MNVQTVDFQSDSAGKQFAQSLHDSGFVVLKNHPVSQQKLDRLYHAWFEFFQNNENRTIYTTRKTKMVPRKVIFR